MNEYKIVVDAGHGGTDPGAVSGNLREKDFNLQAANYMYNRFKELGIPVAITRDNDKTLTRQERLNIMNNTFGTSPNVIILSNHINAGGGEGAEVVYPLRTSPELARSILEAIGEEGQIMRKYYQRRLPENPSKDYYYIMRETPNTTALLIEYGFIDNPSDARKLQNYILDYAEAVVRAVANYIGIPYISPGSSLDNTYIVKKGDTLYSIAKKFNIPVEVIKQLNNLNDNILQIGQKLTLSQDINVEEIPSNAIVYTVQEGDTLYRISRLYNVSVSDIIELNNLQSTILTKNQQLLIPNKSLDQVTTYIVKKGDTLSKIASIYNVTIDELISSNNLTTSVLQIGQVLTIPTGISNNEEVTPPMDEPILDYQLYQVEPGDTLYKIANLFNTSVDKLKRLNNLNTNTLSIGQILTIPSSNNNNNNNIYIVKRGDSLFQIARNNNTTVEAIKNLNNLTSNILQIGQQLLIP